MSRWSERARGPCGGPSGVAFGGALGVALGVTLGTTLGVSGARRAAAQVPAQTPAQRDSARRAAVRRDSVLRDSIFRAAPDSVKRDSIVAAQLRAVRGRPDQSFFQRSNLDRLRLRSVGASAGVAFPDQMRSATIYGVQADYGDLVPNFRVLFGVTYWTSRFTDEAVTGFEQALSTAVAGPPGAVNAVRLGTVRGSDVALTAEVHWRPGVFGSSRPGQIVRPWLGVGAGAHFINVQNPALDGTFVERALDGVAFGPAAAVGVDLTPVRVIQLTAQARYDLFNGTRYPSLRAGGSYVFEPRRRR